MKKQLINTHLASRKSLEIACKELGFSAKGAREDLKSSLMTASYKALVSAVKKVKIRLCS